MDQFPSLKAGKLLSILCRKPLGYRVVRQTGSHRTLEAEGRPTILFAHHDSTTIRPRLVRDILVRQVELDEEFARKLV